MLRSWWSFLFLCACTGESVTSAPADSATPPVVDGAIVETSVVDSAISDGPADVATCASANLIPNGDFASGESGWARGGCLVEALMSAPCGRGLRLFDCPQYGDIHRRVVRKIASKTNLRLRAYFRKSGVGAGTPAAATVRFYRTADGGEVIDEEFAIVAPLNAEWTMSEATHTMINGADGFDVTILSGLESTPGRDEFAVAGVTLEAL